MSNFTKAAVSLIRKNTNLQDDIQMFSVSLHNIMSFHCICRIFNSIRIYLHPVYFQIHVSSSLTVEDLSAKYMTIFALLTSLPSVSLRVASRADSVSHQHPSIWVSDFCRFEGGLVCWGWGGVLGRSILVIVSVHLLVVQLYGASYRATCCSEQDMP